jgi:hypothetical protein
LDDAALCDEIAYEWRRLHAIARLADLPHGTQCEEEARGGLLAPD